MIQNIVSTAFIGHTLDLNLIAQNVVDIVYNPQRFTAAIARYRNIQVLPGSRCIKATFLIFSSGKIVCNGVKTIDDSKKAFDKLQNNIQEVYTKSGSSIKISIQDFTVQNIVGSTSATHKIDLLALHLAYPNTSRYDEIIFPGLRLCPYNNDSTTAIIFISGKFFVTGVKTEKKLFDTINHVRRILLRFKRSYPYETFDYDRLWFGKDERAISYKSK